VSHFSKTTDDATFSEVLGPVLMQRADDIYCYTAISDGPRSAVQITVRTYVHILMSSG